MYDEELTVFEVGGAVTEPCGPINLSFKLRRWHWWWLRNRGVVAAVTGGSRLIVRWFCIIIWGWWIHDRKKMHRINLLMGMNRIRRRVRFGYWGASIYKRKLNMRNRVTVELFKDHCNCRLPMQQVNVSGLWTPVRFA